jgi:hypothetical protein
VLQLRGVRIQRGRGDRLLPANHAFPRRGGSHELCPVIAFEHEHARWSPRETSGAAHASRRRRQAS